MLVGVVLSLVAVLGLAPWVVREWRVGQVVLFDQGA